MKRTGLIDGDVLLYSNGFASDAAAKNKYREEHGSLDGFDINVHHEPLEYCLHMVKKTIEGLLEAAAADDYTVYLSHPVNYREQFYLPYKTNRDVNHKPFWYAEIKDYLLDRHNAVFSEQGDEADDALGQAQMRALADEIETIIITIDKDLDMIPGLHYNFSPTKKANGVYEMEDPDAMRCFFRQMITGDSSDAIPGLFHKTGKKATAKILAPLDQLFSYQDMLEYVSWVFKYDMEHIALVGKLLWIKRTEEWFEL